MTNRPEVQTKLAASYARKSGPDDLGIQDQHSNNAKAARRDGYVIPNNPRYRFSDDATTGDKTSRRGLDPLRAIVQSGAADFSRVYIKDRTRLGRFEDTRMTTYLEVEFALKGVHLQFVQSMAGILATTPGMENFSVVISAIESYKASDELQVITARTAAGKRDRVIRGRFPGAIPPYAMERWLYDEANSRFVERVELFHPVRRAGCTYRLRLGPASEQAVVREVFRLLTEGQSLRAVARELRARNTPARAGRDWTAARVAAIARNPLYYGELIYGRKSPGRPRVPSDRARSDGSEAIVFSNFIDPIVDRQQWQAAQHAMDKRHALAKKRRGPAGRFLLAGLIRCANCGVPYNGHTSSGGGGTTQRRYYRHNPRRRLSFTGTCPAKNRYIPAEALEPRIIELLQNLSDDPLLVAAVDNAFQRDKSAAFGPKAEQQLSGLKRELLDLEVKARRLVEAELANPNGALGVSSLLADITIRFDSRKAGLQASIAELAAKQRVWETSRIPSELITTAALIRIATSTADPTEARQLIRHAIGAITIDADGPDVDVELLSFQPSNR